eukprot:CAMPEP_0181068278 /NCGR_PEP_ID=MMETSP1070-20121207/26331_1 /TAXON_ID=265543 /ORGANISM="Minutocellus polymorphus, Strain NH13" /LENGTH=58 /DNA_ID=CAMNT_0023149013 /DNA_START=83 /DNA_END=259 /DNA_ORIENTATION=+
MALAAASDAVALANAFSTASLRSTLARVFWLTFVLTALSARDSSSLCFRRRSTSTWDE